MSVIGLRIGPFEIAREAEVPERGKWYRAVRSAPLINHQEIIEAWIAIAYMIARAIHPRFRSAGIGCVLCHKCLS